MIFVPNLCFAIGCHNLWEENVVFNHSSTHDK